MIFKRLTCIDTPDMNIAHLCPLCEPDGLAQQNVPVYIPGLLERDIRIENYP